MSGKKIILLGDLGTDHEGFPPTPVIAGSPDVYIDGKPVARLGDPLALHSKPKHPPHPRAITSGSATILINGLPVAVTGSAISCGGVMIGSSSAVTNDVHTPARFSGVSHASSPSNLSQIAKSGSNVAETSDMDGSSEVEGVQQKLPDRVSQSIETTENEERNQANSTAEEAESHDHIYAEITSYNRVQDNGPLKGRCCTQPGENISGTYFFPGAGMDGVYIRPMVEAMREAGIGSAMYVDRDRWSGGTAMDAAIGSVLGRDYDPRFPMLLRISDNQSDQFNLIGYSYGSVVAAQLGAKYALQGTVIDHLVLIGSPISQSFLEKLRSISSIRKVVIIDLDEHGDPIYAGMSVIELFTQLPLLASQMPDSEGHFYYADPSKIGDERRRSLAEALYQIGVR